MAEDKPTSRPLEDVLRELFPLPDLLREFFPLLPEGAEEVLTDYLYAVAECGPQSDLGREYYQQAVLEYPSLREWFDMANEVAEDPLFQVVK